MKASSVAVLTSVIMLCGCAGTGQLLVGSPVAVEHLEGNYKSLAACAYKQLGQRHDQLLMTDLRERSAIKISEARWELLFIDEDGGRQTRLEVTSAGGSFPGEHVLSLVRACAA